MFRDVENIETEDKRLKRYSIAMAQILVEGGKPEQNLERATEMIGVAAERDCKLIVLPECMDLGWTYPGTRELAQPIPGIYSNHLRKAAKRAGIYVAAGLAERSGEHIYNSSVLISPEGEILLKHRKINVLKIENDIYSIGNFLGVVETPLGIIGMNICADNFPDSLALGHSLARMGAELLISPSSWAVDVEHNNKAQPYGEMWRESYSTLSRLYDMTVIGVSNVGRINAGVWRGKKCIGCSLATNPGGSILAEGPYGEAAESLIIIPVEVFSREAKGTEIAPMLRRRGYSGI